MAKSLRHLRGVFRLVYKNMWFGRPKFALAATILFAMLTILNCFMLSIEISYPVAIVNVSFATLLWFVVLPLFITRVDCNRDPERMNRLVETIPEFYYGYRFWLK